MDEKTKQKLAQLDEQIAAAKAVGNRAAQAVAHSQKALLYTLSLDLAGAAGEMAKAGALAEEEGRFEQVAQVHLARGKALMNQPGQREEAVELLENAAALYHTLEDYVHEAEAFKELARLDMMDNNLDSALSRLAKGIAVLENDAASELLAELYRTRFSCHVLRRDFAAAQEDSEAALKVAEESGDRALTLEILLEQYILRRALSDQTAPEQLANYLREAQDAGATRIADDIRLQQAAEAFMAERYVEALEMAREIRSAARDADDIEKYLRYLMASLLMADAQERLDERAEALAALLTCKVYLEKSISPQVGQQMDLILNTLEQRWGRDGLAEAVRVYKQRVQERGPYQV